MSSVIHPHESPFRLPRYVGVIRLTLTDLILARNHIKVQPGAIGTLHHTFGAEDIVRIDKLLKYFLKFCTLEFVRCLLAPAGKYIIC